MVGRLPGCGAGWSSGVHFGYAASQLLFPDADRKGLERGVPRLVVIVKLINFFVPSCAIRQLSKCWISFSIPSYIAHNTAPGTSAGSSN
eukprot:1384992-Rhodomonas_salina.1